MLSFALHSLYIGVIYAAGRWHEKRITRRAVVQRRLDIIRQEGDTQ